MRPLRILVCDDEPQILRALRAILRDGGYGVSAAATLAEALETAAREPPEAAIVDLVLPDGSGIALCEELRSWSRMPIIVLSAVDQEEEKVLALRAGADDYMTKPFSARELIARLEAVFRRIPDPEEQATLRVKGLEIELAAHRVLVEGREVQLTPTEFKLLATLARNRGRLMSTQALLSEVWGSAHRSDAPLLRAHVANLRHKIEGGQGKVWLYIKTEPGLGYRFCE